MGFVTDEDAKAAPEKVSGRLLGEGVRDDRDTTRYPARAPLAAPLAAPLTAILAAPLVATIIVAATRAPVGATGATRREGGKCVGSPWRPERIGPLFDAVDEPRRIKYAGTPEPIRQLVRPIIDEGRGADDEGRPVIRVAERGADRLDGLPKPHLVGNEGAPTMPEGKLHPLTLELEEGSAQPFGEMLGHHLRRGRLTERRRVCEGGSLDRVCGGEPHRAALVLLEELQQCLVALEWNLEALRPQARHEARTRQAGQRAPR